MPQFFQDMPHNPYLATGLLAGLLSSVACGVIGPYVLARRVVFLSGAIAHMALAGVGAAVWLAHVHPAITWFQPVHGAIVAALLGAIIIGVIHQRIAERMDTLIGALWAVGMAVGVLFIKFTPGYHTELMSYLFGNIAYVSREHVVLLALLVTAVVVITFLFHKRLLAICIDEQQAELQGVSVQATNIVLLCLVALTVICLTQIVGLILVIALLTLPAAAAAHHFGRMVSIMGAATGLCMLLTTIPRIVVYGTAISAESAIVLASGGVYLLSVLLKQIRRG